MEEANLGPKARDGSEVRLTPSGWRTTKPRVARCAVLTFGQEVCPNVWRHGLRPLRVRCGDRHVTYVRDYMFLEKHSHSRKWKIKYGVVKSQRETILALYGFRADEAAAQQTGEV